MTMPIAQLAAALGAQPAPAPVPVPVAPDARWSRVGSEARVTFNCRNRTGRPIETRSMPEGRAFVPTRPGSADEQVRARVCGLGVGRARP